MNVLVMGASGGIGLATVKAALAAGHRVTAFSRGAANLTIDHPNLTKCAGDALSPTDVARALVGVDVVVQALGVATRDLFGPISLFSNATRVLLDALVPHGSIRLITVTGFGAGDSADSICLLQRLPFRLLLGRAYDDKSIQETLIKASNCTWTIVRPGVLTDGAETGNYQVLVTPDTWRNGIVARADVAHFIVREIATSAHVGQTPVIVR